MRILVSNDDGVMAPGIRTLASTLESIATIRVVAPDRNRSGASNSLSLTRPLRLRENPNGHISVEGTPTDCVHLAMTGLFEDEIDIVVSGINNGANLGDDIFYSGTVAAAMEGRFLGLPAIAVSLVGDAPEHYDTAATIVKNMVQRLDKEPIAAHTILNVNVPDIPLSEIQGIEITRLGTRHIAEPTIIQTDPRGNTIYWIGPPGLEQDAGPGTDFHAVQNKKISVTPLHLDLTHYSSFDQLSGWMANLEW